MRIKASTVLSYVKCSREAWFIERDIIPDQSNPFIELGRFIHENYYSEKGEKSVELPGIKMDIVWKERQITVVGEIKKSSKAIDSAKAQLLYYLYFLKERGIDAKGYILIPMEKKRIEVNLGKNEEEYLKNLLKEIEKVLSTDVPPSVERKLICKNCGYKELCWA